LFWKDAKKELSRRIVEHFKPNALLETKWTLAECPAQNRQDGLKQYQINFTVHATEGVNSPGISSAKDIGTIIVTATVPLAQIGDRWYVALTEWIPQLIPVKGRAGIVPEKSYLPKEDLSQCIKCGSTDFENDSYHKEHICKKCGWITKETG
jgi:hypothetical protein